jgi:hypothetical protein
MFTIMEISSRVVQKTNAAIFVAASVLNFELSLVSRPAPVVNLRRAGKPIAAKSAEGVKSSHKYSV